MSLSITQNPSSVALAQSPTAFSVFESSAPLRASSSFQYLSELYYWTGSLTESGSTSQYTLVYRGGRRRILQIVKYYSVKFTDYLRRLHILVEAEARAAGRRC